MGWPIGAVVPVGIVTRQNTRTGLAGSGFLLRDAIRWNGKSRQRFLLRLT
jgi:hypothetical protein